MSAPVDVLSVMENFAHNGTNSRDRINAERARAAVAELIEADVHLDEMVARRNKFPCPGMDEHVEKARVRRAAALARVRGAA